MFVSCRLRIMSLRDPEALRNCCEALRNRCERLKLEDPLLQWGDKFVELEECSLNYQISFKNAWKVSIRLITNILTPSQHFALAKVLCIKFTRL